jgi:hypothetical protein
MIERFISQKALVKQYMDWYKTPKTQKTHFKGNKMKLEDITDRDWAILLGIGYLLKPFAVAMTNLSASKHSTLSSVAPTIYWLNDILKQDTLFNKPSEETPRLNQCPYKHWLYDSYEGTDFFDDVLKLLKKTQEHISNKFANKFEYLLVTEDAKKKGRLAWTTLLNPKEYSEWLNRELWDDRTAIVKSMKEDLKEEVFRTAKSAEMRKRTKGNKSKQINTFIEVNDDFKEEANRPITPERKTLGRTLMAMYSPDWEKQQRRQQTQHETLTAGGTKEKDPWGQLRSTVEQDCAAFFGDLLLDMQLQGEYNKNFDVLDYWRKKKEAGKYYWVCKLARKWLAVPAMSTPSERVWSICGIIDDQRRGRMEGFKLESQAMIHNNYKSLAVDHEEIQKKAIELMDEK